MPEYADAGHRPHAVHTGETPKNPISRGPSAITVTLDAWGPEFALFTTMYDALQSNWGDLPSRTRKQPCRDNGCVDPKLSRTWEHQTRWCRLTDEQRAYVESCFAGKTLPQVLELLTFEFTIDGVSRAFTR